MNHEIGYSQKTLADLISNPKTQKAWVVFSGQTELPWLKILKPGFRHCYVIINDGDHWISIDPLSCHTEIMVHHLTPDFDLPSWLRRRNLKVVAADITPQQRQAPVSLYSCVESVKRILGVHDFWVMTPHQLYRRLIGQQDSFLVNSIFGNSVKPAL